MSEEKQQQQQSGNQPPSEQNPTPTQSTADFATKRFFIGESVKKNRNE